MIKFSATEIHDKPNMTQDILLDNGIWITTHGDGTATAEDGSEYLAIGDCWTDSPYVQPIAATVTNPWSKSTYDRDVKDTTADRLQAFLVLIDDDEREQVNDLVNENMKANDIPDIYYPACWLSIWSEMVGPEKAGIVILGS